jgi:hypothetical protein
MPFTPLFRFIAIDIDTAAAIIFLAPYAITPYDIAFLSPAAAAITPLADAIAWLPLAPLPPLPY